MDKKLSELNEFFISFKYPIADRLHSFPGKLHWHHQLTSIFKALLAWRAYGDAKYNCHKSALQMTKVSNRNQSGYVF